MLYTINRVFEIGFKQLSFQRITNATLRRINNIFYSIKWINPFSDAIVDKNKISIYKDKYSGKRCFIIANGPSLKKIDMSYLNNEYTFGMNRIYLMEKINGFRPTFLVCEDKENQLLQFTDEYDNWDGVCFYNYDLKKLFSKKNNQIFIKTSMSPRFSDNPINKPLGCGQSVAYTCIQLAFYMGFERVYIIGKDHNYEQIKNSGDCIRSNGKEKNHFIDGYYKEGMRWTSPDYKTEEMAYKIAKNKYERNNRIIADATIDGKLNVFNKVNYFDLIK